MKTFSLLFTALLAFTLKPTHSFSLRQQVAQDLAAEFGVGKINPLQSCRVNFKNSFQVEDLLRKSSSNWRECDANFKPLRQAASTVEDSFGILHKSSKVVSNTIGKVLTFVKEIEGAANKALQSLKVIPKVGTIVKVILLALQKAKEVLSKIDDNIERIEDYLQKVHLGSAVVEISLIQMSNAMQNVAENMDDAVIVQNAARSCTKRTASCSDDLVVEKLNLQFVGPVKEAKAASAICPNAFDEVEKILIAIANALDLGIFDKIQEILLALEKVLEPIFRKIEELVEQIKEHFNKAYCCVTPVLAQIGIEAFSNVLDVATCPFDGLVAGLTQQMNKLEEAFNNLLISFIAKLFDQLPQLDIRVPVIGVGSLNKKRCTLKLPSLEMVTFNPLAAFIEFGLEEKPSFDFVLDVFQDLKTEIRSTCNDAIDELTDISTSDCCKAFVPLRDGHACDPTLNVPFTRCSQCTSGFFEFHTLKVVTACGKNPDSGVVIDTAEDVAEKVADVAEDAAEKVADVAEDAADAVQDAAQAAGDKVTDFFGGFF